MSNNRARLRAWEQRKPGAVPICERCGDITSRIDRETRRCPTCGSISRRPDHRQYVEQE